MSAATFGGLLLDIKNLRAKLPYFCLQELEVAEGLRTLTFIAQKRRRVIEGSKPDAAFLRPRPMLLCDLEIFADELHSRDTAKTDNDLWLQELRLRTQPVDAGILFGLQRIAVMRRAAFYDIRYVAVMASEVDDAEHIVQKPSGRADKRLTPQILLFTRSFTNEQDLRIVRSDTKDDVRASLAQGTFGTADTRGAQRVKIHHISSP